MVYANEHKQLTVLQWAGLIGGLMMFLTVIVSARMWADDRAEQPIAEPYRVFLEHLARSSTDAELALADYRVRHQRDTVASKHFVGVCAVMVREAKAQGARPEHFSEQMTRGCLQAGRDITDIP
jgi:hypothetical protein